MTAEITLAQKIAVLERELAMRQRVYPRHVAERRMSQADADHQIAVIAACLRDYQIWGMGEPGGIERGREIAAANPDQPTLI